MLGRSTRSYWDACVFLAYVNAETVRVDVVSSLLEAASRGDITLFTSTLTVVEVAFAAAEKEGGVLLPEADSAIIRLFEDRGVLRLVELSEPVAARARALIRAALGRGVSLKPPDAIHLATAEYIDASEFLTYDGSLVTQAPLLGLSFSARSPEPMNLQLGLPGAEGPR